MLKWCIGSNRMTAPFCPDSGMDEKVVLRERLRGREVMSCLRRMDDVLLVEKRFRELVVLSLRRERRVLVCRRRHLAQSRCCDQLVRYIEEVVKGMTRASLQPQV
jgi:hypothetical protein